MTLSLFVHTLGSNLNEKTYQCWLQSAPVPGCCGVSGCFCLATFIEAGTPTINAQCTGNSCPLCDKTLPAAPGHGKQGNNTILNVCVDSSWGTASGVMQQAVQDAASAWNSQTNACNLASGYTVTANQNCSVADIIIHAGTPSVGTCGENALNSVSGTNRSGPDTVTLLSTSPFFPIFNVHIAESKQKYCARP
jgi:hypothetical protein